MEAPGEELPLQFSDSPIAIDAETLAPKESSNLTLVNVQNDYVNTPLPIEILGR